jgi:DNA modification methylase
VSDINLETGDCLAVLKTYPDNSMDSCVTDPPYGLSFMGKKWDYDVPSVEVWKEVFRVLKPGAYLLAFAGTRTQHRMAVNIEDAGFEIRDMIAWMYGQGFPKSHDVSKAIDAAAGAERETGPVDPRRAGRLVNQTGSYDTEAGWSAGNRKVTMDPPATNEAKQWQGWGTALKPALEPITVARKPLEGTVAANVLKYGTGAINIDGCRIETADNLNGGAYAEEGGRGESQSLHGGSGMNQPGKTVGKAFVQPIGRFPANVIMDEEAGKILDEQSGDRPACMSPSKADCEGTIFGGKRTQGHLPMDAGGASRFFYCPKTNKKDRGEGNNHPTVKPTDLMRYLVRLVTPPEGIIIDPFMGSGSTGKAAVLEGFAFIGIDREQAYVDIARARITGAQR